MTDPRQADLVGGAFDDRGLGRRELVRGRVRCNAGPEPGKTPAQEMAERAAIRRREPRVEERAARSAHGTRPLTAHFRGEAGSVRATGRRAPPDYRPRRLARAVRRRASAAFRFFASLGFS